MPSSNRSQGTRIAGDPVADSYAACEQVAGRDKPHLFTAAQRFEWPQTRRAFASTYASMRVIDDYIDDIPRRAALSATARTAATTQIDRWLDRVRAAHGGNPAEDSIWPALADTLSRFDLPLAPWDDLAGAMRSDLFTPAFRDWPHLRRYMAGASVAPAVVFMHLVLMRPEANGRFVCPWDYAQVHAATEDLAIFCYWVHILRDACADLTLGQTGLVYFPTEDFEKFGVTIADLHRMRETGHATDAYRRLARFEAERGGEHLERGRRHLPQVLAAAPPANGEALRSLIDTYVAVLDDLARRDFDVFAS